MHEPSSQKVVLAHGCFDVLHLGHKRHLEEARALGDKLIVSITPDHLINKGPGRPVFTAAQRREMLLALECVDDVVISETGDAAPIITQFKPAVYVKGIDYQGSDNPSLANEIATVEAHGGRFHVTRSEKWSSSRIINGERLPEETLAYLELARTRGAFDRIERTFERADKLNILFVGETIVDEYRYVRPLGKPSKEFILATVEAGEAESFLGGVIAASLHADWPRASVVTDDSQVLAKTRYVDVDFSRKLFEIYSRQRIELTEERRAAFQVKLIDGCRSADVVICFDFGHGLMEAQERHIVEHAKFFAVNAQTNAGNAGFNPVTKYSRADLVCVDEPEARLAAKMQNERAVDDLARAISCDMDTLQIAITRGRRGSAVWCGDDSIEIPSFATKALDTIGAGDAFLAVAAPLVAAGLALEEAAFIGNVAGAIKTNIVGHRRHVGRAELLQAVEALLK